ncbi:hypothetical protein F383_35256 [Gossypium arboreum]|nr:hypothetical protein F383_35256 [Gossypium arboreum]
MYHSYS